MITDKEIEDAKLQVEYRNNPPHHEHNDCIRMAYEWLDAQQKTKSPTKKTYAIKHLIEAWAGRYVSTSDVEVAAYLHPVINGRYPHYNISARLTEPSTTRLEGIEEAFKHDYRGNHKPQNYKQNE